MDTKKKKDPYTCCPPETHIKPRDTYRLKVECWKKVFHANGGQKKARVPILISNKIDFEIKSLKGHCIMIKRSLQEEDITIINIYMHPA